MKKLWICLAVLALLVAFAACGNKADKENDTDRETEMTESTAALPADTDTAAPEPDTDPAAPLPGDDQSETEPPQQEEQTEVDTAPDSNWEGAGGCYYGDNDVTLEVILRGTPEQRRYDLVFYTNEDGKEVKAFTIEGASDVKGNELRATKGSIQYLLIYQPDDEQPRIRIKRENNAGSADFDGLYTIVLG